MFKNPLKYQDGGQMSEEEQLIQIFASAGKNSQVDPKALIRKAQELMNGDQQAYAAYMDNIQKCAKGDSEGIAYIKNLFKNGFKQGGKINAFVCKHAKGGYVAGCNCKENGGEIEINKNGKRISRYSDRNTWGKATSQGDTTINGSYSDHSQEMKITPKGTIYREWNNGDMFPSVSVANQTYFDNHPLIRFFSRNFGIGPKLVKGNEDVVTNMNAAKDAHQNAWIPSNQEGGELTRKEALRLGRENKGYNRGQSRFAYQNAKNTLRNHSNLRGRELRQIAREWVAGRNQAPYYLTPAQKDRWNEVTYGTGTIMSQPLSQGPNIPEPSVVSIGLVGERPSDTIANLDNMSFNNAFRTALNNGKTLFIWKGKPYTTELAQKPSWTNIDINSLPEDVQSNLTGNVYVEIPEVEEPDLSNEYLALQPNTFEKELYRQQLNRLFRRNNSVLPASGAVYKKGGIIKAQKGTEIKKKDKTEFNNYSGTITQGKNRPIANFINNTPSLYHLDQDLRTYWDSDAARITRSGLAAILAGKLASFIPAEGFELGISRVGLPVIFSQLNPKSWITSKNIDFSNPHNVLWAFRNKPESNTPKITMEELRQQVIKQNK